MSVFLFLSWLIWFAGQSLWGHHPLNSIYHVPTEEEAQCWVLSAALDVIKPYTLFRFKYEEKLHKRGPNPSAVNPGNTLLGLRLTTKLFWVQGLPQCPGSGRPFINHSCALSHTVSSWKRDGNQGNQTPIKVYRMTFLQRIHSSPTFIPRGDRILFSQKEQR